MNLHSLASQIFGIFLLAFALLFFGAVFLIHKKTLRSAALCLMMCLCIALLCFFSAIHARVEAVLIDGALFVQLGTTATLAFANCTVLICTMCEPESQSSATQRARPKYAVFLRVCTINLVNVHAYHKGKHLA